MESLGVDFSGGMVLIPFSPFNISPTGRDAPLPNFPINRPFDEVPIASVDQVWDDFSGAPPSPPLLDVPMSPPHPRGSLSPPHGLRDGWLHAPRQGIFQLVRSRHPPLIGGIYVAHVPILRKGDSRHGAQAQGYSFPSKFLWLFFVARLHGPSFLLLVWFPRAWMVS